MTTPETPPEAAAGPPLDPETRARPGIAGTPVVLADGRTWTLADGIPDLARTVWDGLYRDNRLAGAYDPGDVATAACHLLRANYDLGLPEAFGLIAGADIAALVPAVERALFGLGRPGGTFTDWALTSLWANGIDPDRLPRHLLWPVLLVLERTGRAEPRAAVIAADRAAAERARFEALVRSLNGPRPAASAGAGTPPGPPATS